MSGVLRMIEEAMHVGILQICFLILNCSRDKLSKVVHVMSYIMAVWTILCTNIMISLHKGGTLTKN